MKVWILFSVANEYDQPPKAFEKLFWHKPCYEDLKGYGFTPMMGTFEHFRDYSGAEYWIEEFTKPE